MTNPLKRGEVWLADLNPTRSFADLGIGVLNEVQRFLRMVQDVSYNADIMQTSNDRSTQLFGE